jgi:hypothetical protein
VGLKEECIEAAKGAIAEADGGDIGFRSYNEDKRWENLATAAFTAIMERMHDPSEGIVEAGAEGFAGYVPMRDSNEDVARDVWQAMLAAAAE